MQVDQFEPDSTSEVICVDDIVEDKNRLSVQNQVHEEKISRMAFINSKIKRIKISKKCPNNHGAYTPSFKISKHKIIAENEVEALHQLLIEWTKRALWNGRGNLSIGKIQNQIDRLRAIFKVSNYTVNKYFWSDYLQYQENIQGKILQIGRFLAHRYRLDLKFILEICKKRLKTSIYQKFSGMLGHFPITNECSTNKIRQSKTNACSNAKRQTENNLPFETNYKHEFIIQEYDCNKTEHTSEANVIIIQEPIFSEVRETIFIPQGYFGKQNILAEEMSLDVVKTNEKGMHQAITSGQISADIRKISSTISNNSPDGHRLNKLGNAKSFNCNTGNVISRHTIIAKKDERSIKCNDNKHFSYTRRKIVDTINKKEIKNSSKAAAKTKNQTLESNISNNIQQSVPTKNFVKVSSSIVSKRTDDGTLSTGYLPLMKTVQSSRKLINQNTFNCNTGSAKYRHRIFTEEMCVDNTRNVCRYTRSKRKIVPTKCKYCVNNCNRKQIGISSKSTVKSEPRIDGSNISKNIPKNVPTKEICKISSSIVKNSAEEKPLKSEHCQIIETVRSSSKVINTKSFNCSTESAKFEDDIFTEADELIKTVRSTNKVINIESFNYNTESVKSEDHIFTETDEGLKKCADNSNLSCTREKQKIAESNGKYFANPINKNEIIDSPESTEKNQVQIEVSNCCENIEPSVRCYYNKKLHKNSPSSLNQNLKNDFPNSDDVLCRYYCEICLKVFDSFNEMQIHFGKTICANKLRTFHCYNCLNNIYGFCNFMKHLTECDNIEIFKS
ncbi:uncharacterized protein LOC142233595 [Haematobia irritans]|uniref:uncharacterized protein LOC142233595 n=1 Tax=Haematobia irritans TaxID=7368 RepID=UPI003F4F8BBA